MAAVANKFTHNPFIIKHRAEKTARNISRNTTVIVPAHNIPAFKPSKAFAGRMKSDK